MAAKAAKAAKIPSAKSVLGTNFLAATQLADLNEITCWLTSIDADKVKENLVAPLRAQKGILTDPIILSCGVDGVRMNRPTACWLDELIAADDADAEAGDAAAVALFQQRLKEIRTGYNFNKKEKNKGFRSTKSRLYAGIKIMQGYLEGLYLINAAERCPAAKFEAHTSFTFFTNDQGRLAAAYPGEVPAVAQRDKAKGFRSHPADIAYTTPGGIFIGVSLKAAFKPVAPTIL